MQGMSSEGAGENGGKDVTTIPAAKVVISPIPPESFLEGPPELDASTYWWETDMVCVPWVMGNNPQAFLCWLRELEAKGKPVFFPTVINGRLDALLRHRDYVDALWPIDERNEVIEVLIKWSRQ